jgi:SAM-dependent methyltransferase
MLRKELHEQNRISWNLATEAHNSHKVEQAKFFREGGSTLFPEEIELLGDIRGKSLVHLQCNAGQDTLSLARLGANVTGVDISDTAIEFARKLSEEAGIAATFHRADVYDWMEETAKGEERFDVAFSSYGAVIWLSDIAKWARGIASILKPGGRFVLVEFHPYWMTLEGDWENPEAGEWKLTYPYFQHGRGMYWDEGIGDYVAMSGEALAPMGFVEGVQDFKNPHPVTEFQWNISEVITAFLEAGMTLEAFKEYPYSNGGRLFPGMKEGEGNRFYPPETTPSLPLMYGLAARKP